jgi:hypothetical protein
MKAEPEIKQPRFFSLSSSFPNDGSGIELPPHHSMIQASMIQIFSGRLLKILFAGCSKRLRGKTREVR